jgi:hypothetical protein
MVTNGYTRLHRLTLEVEAQMLESAAGLTEGRVREELAYAVRTLDKDDPGALQWLAVLCERRVDDIAAREAVA